LEIHTFIFAGSDPLRIEMTPGSLSFVAGPGLRGFKLADGRLITIHEAHLLYEVVEGVGPSGDNE
jgi:hypothetical protein